MGFIKETAEKVEELVIVNNSVGIKIKTKVEKVKKNLTGINQDLDDIIELLMKDTQITSRNQNSKNERYTAKKKKEK
jgi:Skp family chaperone for outer membrane proteins